MHSPIATDRCPFIELDDERCASRFTLSHLAEAFEMCFDRYQSCPTYYRLAQQHPDKQLRVHLTAHGRSLQPTGS